MKWTMTDFLSGEFDVLITSMVQYYNFMRQLDIVQVKWLSGDKASAFHPQEPLPFFVRYNFDGCKRLSYGNVQRRPARTMTEYVWQKETTSTPKRYKVEIECDGTTTTAKLIVDGKKVKSATAKKHPDDKFNLKLGMETAFSRLWDKTEKTEKTEKKEADPTPVATEPTDPKLRFKVGDRVIYTNAETIAPHFKGKHGRIVVVGSKCAPYEYGVEFDEPARRPYEFAHDCEGYAKHSHGLWVYDNALIPEPSQRVSTATGNHLRFHAGDRVVVTNAPGKYDCVKGLHGKIINVEDHGYFDYAMQFDQCLIGRDVYIPISINGKDGHCLWVNDTWLEPETTETT